MAVPDVEFMRNLFWYIFGIISSAGQIVRNKDVVGVEKSPNRSKEGFERKCGLAEFELPDLKAGNFADYFLHEALATSSLAFNIPQVTGIRVMT